MCFNILMEVAAVCIVGLSIGLVAAVAVEFLVPVGRRKLERRYRLHFVRILDFDILEGQTLAKHLLSFLLQYH